VLSLPLALLATVGILAAVFLAAPWVDVAFSAIGRLYLRYLNWVWRHEDD
jgi:threonine/homoserine/homoserine lactone efflux protein